MKKILNLFTATLVCIAFSQTTVLASSHREAPLIAYDPVADNTDVYAFRNPCDTNKVVLIANFIPFELPHGGPNYYNFGPNIRYEIKIDNEAASPGAEIIYRFTFTQVNQDPTTFFNIRLGKQNLKTVYRVERSTNGGGSFIEILGNGVVPPNNIGPRSITNPVVGLGAVSYDALANSAISGTATGEVVFAGPRDDPFFVDLGGAFDVGNFRTNGRDGLAKFNVHSIAISVDISQLQKNGKVTTQATSMLDADFVIGVYATASRPRITTFDSTGGAPIASGPWVQVSRLGMPLTNEVVIPIGMKDRWNSTATGNENEFDVYLKNPELALYMDDSQFGTAVPGLAPLRIQTNSLGMFDFRNGKKGLYVLKGNPALIGTALDPALFGNYLLPDSVSPRAVDLLPIFKTGVPNLRPYQLATGKGGNPLAAGKPFVNNFLPTFGDMLRLNMAVPVTPRNDPKFSRLGLIQAAVLGLTDPMYNGSAALQFIPNMDGFPNGRRLEDDVTTIELQAVGGVVLAAIGLWYDDYNPMTSPSPVTPQLMSVLNFHAGVTQNDTSFKACFPFLQTPWAGFTGAGYVGPMSVQGPLPVDFLDFTADKSGEKVQLRWKVTNEINNARYEVEHSLGNGVFNKIGSVPAIQGGIVNNYQLLHTSPSLSKTNYYRIKQVDRDGRSSYSPIRLVKFSSKNTLTILPNPATDFIKVYSDQSSLNIHLYDDQGRKLASKQLSNGSVEIDIRNFAKGVYIIVAESKGITVETTKIVKQ